MNYFVSVEGPAYWQVELLIESFKRQNLQDRLVVAVARTDLRSSRNLLAHKRTFAHDNVGRKRGCVYLNRPYSVYMALAEGLLTQPFTLLAPDMLLNRPVPMPAHHITFQIDPLFTAAYARPYTPRRHSWLPMGAVQTFNQMPVPYFSRVIEWAEALEFDRQKAGLPPWNHIERAAWIMAALEAHPQVGVQGRYDLESGLLDDTDRHFVHYRTGCPPHFTKTMCRPGLSLVDPYTAITQGPDTPARRLAQAVTAAYTK